MIAFAYDDGMKPSRRDRQPKRKWRKRKSPALRATGLWGGEHLRGRSGLIISKAPVFGKVCPRKSYYQPWRTTAKLLLSHGAPWAGIGVPGALGAQAPHRRRFFIADEISMAGCAARPKGRPVPKARYANAVQSVSKLIGVSRDGSFASFRSHTMNHPTLGELRPIPSKLSQLAAKIIAAGDLLFVIAEEPPGISPDYGRADRLEAVIEMLCDVAVELGDVVAGLREGGAA